MKTYIQKILNFLRSTQQFLTHDIWVLDFSKLSRARAFGYHQLLVVVLVGRAFIHDRLLVRASALVYATLLSIVPLLAVMFSLLKVFGFHNNLDPTLRQLFEPLGTEAVSTIVPNIVNFVDHVRVGALGTLGFLFLFLSVLSIVNNIERAFNDVWKIHKVRSIHRRFTDYLSVLLVGPVLVFTFLGLTASLQSLVIVQAVSKIPGVPFVFNKTIPIILTWLFFYFILSFVPNTKVKTGSAIIGAIISGTLWMISNYFFAHFIVTSYQIGTKAAVYAGFATLPLLLIWMFMSWAIVLLGVEVSYVYQNVNKITWELRDTNFSYSIKSRISLKIILYVAECFYKGDPPPSANEISDVFNVPNPLINEMLNMLTDQELLYMVDREPPGYAPSKSLDKLQINKIFDKIKSHGSNQLYNEQETSIGTMADHILADYEKAVLKAFKDTSLLDVLRKEDPEIT